MADVTDLFFKTTSWLQAFQCALVELTEPANGSARWIVYLLHDHSVDFPPVWLQRLEVVLTFAGDLPIVVPCRVLTWEGRKDRESMLVAHLAPSVPMDGLPPLLELQEGVEGMQIELLFGKERRSLRGMRGEDGCSTAPTSICN